MSAPLRIGIIGCGDIARKAYIPGIRSYDNLQLMAVADIDLARAQSLAAEAEIAIGCGVDQLLARDDIDLVVNLTIPIAHAAVDRQILEAGKHAYAEKPLAVSAAEAAPVLALAEQRGLRLGSAPDTVLGAGIQGARRLLDAGAIGEPLSFTACMACPGHESWHPAPEFYYDAGGGPLYDMGPYYLSALVTLLGPVAEVCALSSRGWDERLITSQPKAGSRCPVRIDTHINASLRFANGVIGSLIMSFDTWRHNMPKIELHGREGSMAVPDPNSFGGPLLLNTRSQPEWHEQELLHPKGRRGLGIADLAAALVAGRPHRSDARMANHIQEVMDAIHACGSSGGSRSISSSCQRPEALAVDEPWRSDHDSAAASGS
ncbi:MAG: gfo/Idh/MocA family oxidoreductase [Planctomycetota bacterium]|nr:MAG: gfo/Idh/MocA family oxidoreductase [Planctomycetota bacterium]